MKKIAVLLLSFFCFYSIYGQVVYYTGFDSISDQTAWTEYRLGDLDNQHWGFSTDYTTSPLYCLYHDYPMDNNTDSIEDWFVSPALFISATSGVNLNVRQSRMSFPPAVYFGVWFSDGSPDPASGDYVEIGDLTLFPTEQYVYHDTDLVIPNQADTGYIALKYKAGYYEWLMVWVDDILISGAYPLGINSNTIDDKSEMLVYPNPCSSSFKLSISQDVFDKFSNISLELYNGYGQKVREVVSISDKTITINRGMLNGGIYFYKLKNNNQLLKSGKLIFK